MSAFSAILAMELALARRRGTETLLALGFFVLALGLFPFGIGPDPETLARAAPGLLWVTALLAAMLALERLFAADFEDGSLDHLLLLETPLELTVLAKAAAHWIATGLPLVLAAPVAALVLGLPPGGLPVLVASLALGTPTLTLIGTIGAGLTLGARRGGVLIALLVLPLYVPVLIFGAGAVEGALRGAGAAPPLMALGAFLLAALALAPFAAAAALRQAAR